MAPVHGVKSPCPLGHLLGDNMTNRREFIIEAATSIKAIADSIIGWVQEWEDVPPPTPIYTPWPAAIECLGGTVPPVITIPPGDGVPQGQQPEPAYTRRINTLPSGTIGIFGDSILQMMHENRMHKAAYNFALGGQSLRRLSNSLRTGFPFMHGAGAGVLMCGVNDLGNTTYYGPWTNGQAAGTIVTAIMQNKLSPYFTGKWVICHLLPIDEIFTNSPFYNQQIANINAGINAAFAGCAAEIAFIPVDPDWVDAQGNLKDVYHIDGQHPSAAFCRIYEDRISGALASLGL